MRREQVSPLNPVFLPVGCMPPHGVRRASHTLTPGNGQLGSKAGSQALLRPGTGLPGEMPTSHPPRCVPTERGTRAPGVPPEGAPAGVCKDGAISSTSAPTAPWARRM